MVPTIESRKLVFNQTPDMVRSQTFFGYRVVVVEVELDGALRIRAREEKRLQTTPCQASDCLRILVYLVIYVSG